MVKPREMTVSQVCIDFANEKLHGDSVCGRAFINGRCLFVDNQLMALHSRSKNVYVNCDHADVETRKALLCYLPASEVLRVDTAEIAELCRILHTPPVV
jgi:hypothetical protein